MRTLFILLTLLGALYAQSDSLLLQADEFDEEATALTEILAYWRVHPVSVNDADRATLLRMPYLTSRDVDVLIRYRDEHDGIHHSDELKQLWGETLYALVRPYITLKSWNGPSLRMYQRGYLNSDSRRDITARYPGNALYSYTRLEYRYNQHISAGMVWQKDPGETAWNDHQNYYLRYATPDYSLLAGGFYPQMGHGLIFGGPYAARKSFVPAASLQREAVMRLKPDLTSAERQGMNGVAFTWRGFPSSGIHVFYARNRRDAALKNGVPYALRTDGYHRTERELRQAGALTEETWGAAMGYHFSTSLSLTAALCDISYDPPVVNNAALLGEALKGKQYFAFSGAHNRLISLAARGHTASGWNLAGEFARDAKQGRAMAGTVYFKKAHWESGARFWYLSPDFQSPFGRVFENNALFPRAERGYYLTFSYKSAAGWRLAGYHLYRQRLWRTYNTPWPGQSAEQALQWTYRHARRAWLLRYRHVTDEVFKGSEWHTATGHKVRLEIETRTGALRHRGRVAFTATAPFREQGWLVFHQIGGRWSRSIRYTLRATFFRTDSWESRIYEYEPDIPGAFANYALFGRGFKWSVRLDWRINAGIHLWLKGRYLEKDGQSAVGHTTPELNREMRMGVLIHL
ncbi:MAG: hypothetical protein D6677_06015 [Calditrichaeota bacterium]|nr:MAG: hypothetical protein D6677_06015 [Calditrichota bacterium]